MPPKKLNMKAIYCDKKMWTWGCLTSNWGLNSYITYQMEARKQPHQHSSIKWHLSPRSCFECISSCLWGNRVPLLSTLCSIVLPIGSEWEVFSGLFSKPWTINKPISKSLFRLHIGVPPPGLPFPLFPSLSTKQTSQWISQPWWSPKFLVSCTLTALSTRRQKWGFPKLTRTLLKISTWMEWIQY